MKRALRTTLPVTIEMDLDRAERILFVFAQGSQRLLFEYPSNRAIRREGENIIDLIWTKRQTMNFIQGQVDLDTHITLIDTPDNPQTEIVSFTMNPTLFKLREVESDDTD